MKESYVSRRDSAVDQTKRVDIVKQDHPKSWDRYIESRKKAHKEISHAPKR